MYENNISHLIRKELESLNITVDDINISHDHSFIHTSGKFSPVDREVMRSIMDISFTCKKLEYKYLSAFVNQVEQIHVPVSLPIKLINGIMSIDSSEPKLAEYETYYKCTMGLYLTGGSIDPFIKQFKAATEKLRYVVESKKFDEEVEKVLTENNHGN